MAKVLVIGVAVADFVFFLDRIPDEARKYRANAADIVGGGCAANAAVAIARLGGSAMLGARLGDDAVGDLILSDLCAEGVDTTLVQKTAGAKSSFSSVQVDSAGDRQIVNFRGADLAPETDWIGQAGSVDAILTDTRWSEGARAALLLARDRGIPGIVDAEAPLDQSVLELASHVAFSRDGLTSFCSNDDLEGALLEADKQLDAWVCVTDGGNGAFIADNGMSNHIPAFQVDVKDTLGAGDIWHGAFALALARGSDETVAVRFANAASALKCTQFGGRRGAPTEEQLNQFLKENPS